MRVLAEAGREDVDVVVIFVLVDLIEDRDPRAHTVLALRVVGPPADLSLRSEGEDALLLPAKPLLQALLVVGGVEGVDDVEDGPESLFLIVRADVDVIARDPVVGRGEGDGLESDRPVLPGASPEHTKEIRPARETGVGVVGTVVERDDELLPGEDGLEGEILREPDVVIGLFLVDIDVFVSEAVFHMIDESLDLLRRPEVARLDLVDEALDVRV